MVLRPSIIRAVFPKYGLGLRAYREEFNESIEETASANDKEGDSFKEGSFEKPRRF
jgi:hypothetical protein